jgi:hypothetical protein
MTSEEYLNDKLWPILVETVHALVMYTNHKAYTRDTMMIENPGMAAAQLAVRLDISLGEALVILYELAEERKREPRPP